MIWNAQPLTAVNCHSWSLGSLALFLHKKALSLNRNNFFAGVATSQSRRTIADRLKDKLEDL
jgi:hypothetical protein